MSNVLKLALEALLISDARLYDEGKKAIAALGDAIKMQGVPVAWWNNKYSPPMFSITKGAPGMGAEGEPLFTQAPTVPEGWQLVPITPTNEMTLAAVQASLSHKGQINGVPQYKAMLTAAAKPRTLLHYRASAVTLAGQKEE